jgi:hypothetical protein
MELKNTGEFFPFFHPEIGKSVLLYQDNINLDLNLKKKAPAMPAWITSPYCLLYNFFCNW